MHTYKQESSLFDWVIRAENLFWLGMYCKVSYSRLTRHIVRFLFLFLCLLETYFLPYEKKSTCVYLNFLDIKKNNQFPASKTKRQ